MNMLRGSRILVTMPEIKKSAIEVTAADEEQMMQEAMQKWQKLDVFAVGAEVKDITPGDKVYIQTYAIQSAERIEIDGDMRMLIPESAVALVW